MVGTAYDYVLRFMLQRKYECMFFHPWVAEQSLARLSNLDDKIKGYRIVTNALANLNSYLKTGKIELGLLRSAIGLAQLDMIYRAGTDGENLGSISKDDLLDLNRLTEITNLKLFRPKELIFLNPTFKEASRLVGGADADLLIDDCLVEIKTTNRARFDRDTFNQLIGYYVLSMIGGISFYSQSGQPKIKRLGVYYSRYAQIVSFRVSQIATLKEMKRFVRHFKKIIEKNQPYVF